MASVEQDLDFSLNRHPESIEVSSSELSENLVNGTEVLRFSTVDLDDDDMFDYSFAPGFGSLDNDMFTISGNSLISHVPADYESDPHLNIRIRSTDQGGFSVVERFVLDVIG